MKAVILAAGEGARLRPLSSTRPKHMLPVAGKPLLEHLLQSIESVGIVDVAILVGYLGEKIKRHFGNGSPGQLKLTYIEQEHPLGTAKAIGLVEDYVDGEDFLLIYGDLWVKPEAIFQVLRCYQTQSTTTIGVVPVEKTADFGIVEVKEDKVKAIIEKPKKSVDSNFANTGIYIFTNEIFVDIHVTEKSERGEYEITDTLQSLISKGKDIGAAFVPSDSWLDIGRPWNLLEANERIMKELQLRLDGTVEEGAHCIGPVIVEKRARVRSGAYLEGPVLVGEGCDVGPNCYLRSFTSLGKNVRVGNACEVKNSIIMDRTHVGHLSYVGDSVIGENCNLGAGTITANLRFDEDTIKIHVKEKLTDSGLRKLGVFLGDGVKTGIGALIMPGVKIGTQAWVGPGVLVNRDLEENTIIRYRGENQTTSYRDRSLID